MASDPRSNQSHNSTAEPANNDPRSSHTSSIQEEEGDRTDSSTTPRPTPAQRLSSTADTRRDYGSCATTHCKIVRLTVYRNSRPFGYSTATESFVKRSQLSCNQKRQTTFPRYLSRRPVFIQVIPKTVSNAKAVHKSKITTSPR